MSEYGAQVTYSTLCDMVGEVIDTEGIIRNALASSRQVAIWEAERFAMMRAVSHVVSGGRDGSGRYNTAFEYMRQEIMMASTLPPAGTIVISLRNLIARMDHEDF